MKRIIALLLAVLMVAALFAGCAPTETPGSSDNTNPSGDNSTPSTPSSDGDIPTLVWYQVGGGTSPDLDQWHEVVNAYLEEKIGCHLQLNVVDWGTWGDRRTMIVQTNEPYDLIFTDMSTYANDVKMGAFADLTDLLADYPGLTETIPEDYMKGVQLADGHIYGIPAYKDTAMTNFFIWTKNYENANGEIVNVIDECFPEYADAHTLAEIDPGVRAINEKYPDLGPTMGMNKDGISCIIGNRYDAFASTLPAIGVSYYTGEAKVVSVFEQEDVLEQLRQMHVWFQDGIINSDANTLGEFSGMTGVGVAQGWPSNAGSWGQGRGTEVVVSQFGDPVLSNDTVQGSITCINASSQNKEMALKFLELVNTDTKLRDMLAWGIEGVHFEYVEVDGMQKIHKLNDNWKAAAYTQGSTLHMTWNEADVGDPVSEILHQNEIALRSPALGFYFDNTPVASQLAACVATWMEYKPMLVTGAGDPDVYVPQMLEAMRADGLDEVIAEAQRQLDEYIASQG